MLLLDKSVTNWDNVLVVVSQLSILHSVLGLALTHNFKDEI